MRRPEEPNEQQLLEEAVADLAAATHFPLAFGGLEYGGAVTIASLVGNRTHSLDGLRIQPERGLGGKAMAERRPRITGNYETSKHITHDYDGRVLPEGIVTLLAVPVVVSGRTRGILYGGSHSFAPVGDVFAKPALAIADKLGQEIRVRDEVARRLALVAPEAEIAPRLAPAQQQDLRESYAELRTIAAGVEDPALREKLQAVERRLAGLSLSGAQQAMTDVRLSPREIDVLACAALGYRNAEVGHVLGLTESTVKSYLSAAMSKLDASTRHAAVAAARKQGIIP